MQQLGSSSGSWKKQMLMCQAEYRRFASFRDSSPLCTFSFCQEDRGPEDNQMWERRGCPCTDNRRPASSCYTPGRQVAIIRVHPSPELYQFFIRLLAQSGDSTHLTFDLVHKIISFLASNLQLVLQLQLFLNFIRWLTSSYIRRCTGIFKSTGTGTGTGTSLVSVSPVKTVKHVAPDPPGTTVHVHI